MAGGGGAKRILFIFLRGGNDGLNVVIPDGDPDYSTVSRPTLYIPTAESIDLNGFARLHPSLADLMEAMGLQKGSIYKAFGSKHALFLQVLQRYLDNLYSMMVDGMAGATSPTEAIRRYLEFVRCMGLEGETRRGCLAVNTLMELGPHDEEVRATLERHQRRAVRALARVIAEGQEDGSVRDDASAEDLATYLMMVSAGLIATSKSSSESFDSPRVAELAFSALEVR